MWNNPYLVDLGGSCSLSHKFSEQKFTRFLLPHPHFFSQPPHAGPTLDDPRSWSPGERVEECVCGERSHGERFAQQLWPFPQKSIQEQTQALQTVRCSFPKKSWTPYGAAGIEKLLEKQGVVIPTSPATGCWPGLH